MDAQVKHRSDGRVNIYRPVIRRQQVTQTMVSDLADRLFSGDVAEMVCHLLDGNDVTHADLLEVKRLIRKKERELDDVQ